jgi:hypothetical protein
MKVLIVASEPVDEEVIDLLTEDEVPDEVRVIAPTLPGSALRYWLNDTDPALARAERVALESLQEFDEAGIPATADAPTDDEPAISIDDALRDFDPDRVLVVKHGEGDEAYREDSLVDEIEAHTDAPIDVRTVNPGEI